MPMKNKMFELLKRSIAGFSADNGASMAASISFNLLFSVVPLIFIAVYVTRFIPEAQGVQDQIATAMSYLVPESRDVIRAIISNATKAGNEIGALAFIGVVWGGISFFSSVRHALNTAWGIRIGQPFLKGQLINVIMLVAAGALVVLSVAATMMFNSGAEPAARVTAVEYVSHRSTVLLLTNILFTVLAFLAFMLLYRFIPVKRPRWKDIWAGALVGAIAFEITKVVFIRYLRIFHPYDQMFGSLEAAIAFLMWTYLSALIFLFMAKVSCEYLKLKGETQATR
jgi:membrane protein